MIRRTAISILGLFALAACARKGARSSDFDSATAAALAVSPPGAPPANQPKIAHVSGFEFGHRLDRHNVVVGGTTTQFAGADSILISVRVQYAASDVDVSARLRQNNRTVDSTGTKVGPADSTGLAVLGLRFSGAKGGKGTYQAEIFLNGKFQVSKEFTIVQ